MAALESDLLSGLYTESKGKAQGLRSHLLDVQCSQFPGSAPFNSMAAGEHLLLATTQFYEHTFLHKASRFLGFLGFFLVNKENEVFL